MKNNAYLLFAAALVVGCGGGSGGSDRNAALSPLVGSWRLTRVVGSQGALSVTLNCPGDLNLPTVGSATCGDQELLTFRADGTFTASGTLSVSGVSVPIPTLPTNVSGTWSLASDVLTLTPAGAAVGVSATIRISGTTATVTQTQTTGTTTITGTGTLERQ